jgi:hypothetical protein
MSDTPETDAVASPHIGFYSCATVPAEFARRLERERDEARTELEMWRDGNILHEIHRNELEKVERERDEARDAIPDGEWVAHEDYRKVHDAASRLLVAINKQLPIGFFTLVGSEYYRLQNAIYGREETK